MDAYRPIETVAVVVQLSSFFQKIKLDPVVETRHFPSLDLPYSVKLCVTSEPQRKRVVENISGVCKSPVLSAPAKMCSKPLESILLLYREYRPNHIILRS